MSKRKKTRVSEENQALIISKAKKTHKRKSQATKDCDLEKPAEAFDAIKTISKATVAEAVQECKEHSLDITGTDVLPTNLDVSLAEENKKVSSERKGRAKSFAPPPPAGRLVPVFAKTKDKVRERREENNGDTPEIHVKQDVLESSDTEQLVRNTPCDTAGKSFQNASAPSESLEMMDLSATNKEDAGDQDVKIHNKDMNNGNTISGFTDSQIEEAQKPTDTPANIPEKQKTKSKKRVSFFLCTSDHKDAHGLEERELSAESLDHVKNNQNEDAPEGPTLPTEHGTNNKCEKLGPIIKQSACDACDIRPQEVSGTLSNSGADQQMEVDQQVDGKEKTGLCEESNFVSVEGCISSAEIISQLDGAVAGSESCRENPGSEAQESLLPEGKVSCTSPLGSHGTATPTCSTVKDLLSVNLDFLLDSQLQNIFESNSLDRSPHKPSSLDVPCTSRGTKPVANVAHPNNAGDEMTVRICDPSKEEDATNVVCGLIKELSNLNRLVMSTHRDLDSFKRLKFQRYRQLGQHLPHRMNTTTNMRGAVKKKKRVLLGNARAPFDTCKAFLSSSDVSSAETSKAVATHSVADAQDHHGRGQSLKNETYPDAKNP